MIIEFNLGMICTFEEKPDGSTDFCIYPSKEALGLDEDERVKLRILTFSFATMPDLLRFFYINYACASNIQELKEGKSIAQGKGH